MSPKLVFLITYDKLKLINYDTYEGIQLNILCNFKRVVDFILNEQTIHQSPCNL